MKSFIKLLVPAFFTVILASSCLSRDEKAMPKNPATPKALQGKTDEILSSYRSRGNDLVDEVYDELLEKKPDLKKLESDIAAYKAMEPDSLAKYHAYQIKSTSFYSAAEFKLNTITDSVLKHQMEQLLAHSQARFDNKVALINKLIKGLETKGADLSNYHTALKLIVTLQTVEKFQQDELPDDKVLNDLTTQKQKLTDRTKQLADKTH